MKIYEKQLTRTVGGKLTETERQLFLNVGRNLLSDDSDYRRDGAAQLSGELDRQITFLTKEYQRKKKAAMASCLCASALAVILLL